MIRGQALLGLGRAAEAAAAFERAIQYRYSAEPTVLGPIAQVWLARARARQGDVPGARRAYQDFFGLWKDADPGLTLLAEARKEYDALD
jgi:hypothetical protein